MNADDLIQKMTQFTIPIDSMPYIAALRKGEATKEQALRAETVEIYRAMATRHEIHNIFLDKMDAAHKNGLLSDQDVMNLEHVIGDEQETEEHADHLDIRFQIFDSIGITRDNVRFVRHPYLDKVNNEWKSVFEQGDIFSLIAVNAALEGWYVPVAQEFEQHYISRGFSETEVETYAVHKEDDVWHSRVGYEVLARNADKWSIEQVENAVQTTFRTALSYEHAKLALAKNGILNDTLASPIDYEGLRHRGVAQGIHRFVTAAIVPHPEQPEKILLLQRMPDEFMPNIYEFPGGVVEEHEPLGDAIIREYEEETGLDHEGVTSFVGIFEYLSGSGKLTRQFNFVVPPTKVEKVTHPEHQDHAWVGPEEISKYDISNESLGIMNDYWKQNKLI